MHSYDLIITLTGGLTAALIFGYITQRLGLSPIVGYLIAGTLVGPQTPGLVVNTSLAEQMAEIGVILLMFGVGLQFHVQELLAVRRVALPGALAASSVATALGALLALAAGFSRPSAIIYGAALAVASTVVLIRVLSDRNELHTPTGHIAVGWLVVEDMLTVLATDRESPNTRPVPKVQPSRCASPMPMAVAVTICATAPGSAMYRTDIRSLIEKCSPTPNISRITPISASWFARPESATNPGVKGPTQMPAMR